MLPDLSSLLIYGVDSTNLELYTFDASTAVWQLNVGVTQNGTGERKHVSLSRALSSLV